MADTNEADRISADPIVSRLHNDGDADDGYSDYTDADGAWDSGLDSHQIAASHS